jgi:hypothetical protein
MDNTEESFVILYHNNNNNNNNNKHSLRSNAKGYGGKTHNTDSQSSDTTTPSGKELYHLQFSLQAACPETFGYTLVQLPVPSAQGNIIINDSSSKIIVNY